MHKMGWVPTPLKEEPERVYCVESFEFRPRTNPRYPRIFEDLNRDTIGISAAIATPFGRRIMRYCDFTASGRALQSVENYILTKVRKKPNRNIEFRFCHIMEIHIP